MSEIVEIRLHKLPSTELLVQYTYLLRKYEILKNNSEQEKIKDALQRTSKAFDMRRSMRQTSKKHFHNPMIIAAIASKRFNERTPLETLSLIQWIESQDGVLYTFFLCCISIKHFAILNDTTKKTQKKHYVPRNFAC